MLKQIPNGVVIKLHVLPNAPKSQIVGEHNGALKIKIKAPPVDGKANQAILAFFSAVLKLPKSRLEILKGDKSKTKSLLVRDVTKDSVEQMLQGSKVSG